jgi:hypothetical protein
MRFTQTKLTIFEARIEAVAESRDASVMPAFLQ